MTTRLARNVRLVIVALAVTSLSGCATLSADEQEEHRAELDEMGDRAIAKLLETRPETSELLEQCVGYAVINMQVTKIPVFGAGGGYGVVRDQNSDAHSYIKVSRFEVGGGLGTQKFKVIIFFSDEKLLNRALSGSWHFEAGAEAVAGESSIEDNLNKSGEGYSAFRIGESGAVATVTIRVARATPYLE
jgi:lipid-binding SYLF domain-containing protein